MMLGNASSELLKVCPPVFLHFEQHLDEALAQLQLPSLLVSEIVVTPVCVQFFMLREH